MLALHPNENKILEVRRHILVFYGRMLWLVVLLLLPLIVFSTTRGYLEGIFGGNEGLVFSFFYFLWLIILWMIFFYQWTDYYFDVWIITDERLVDIEQRGFFNRHIATLRLERIQDANISIEGLLATLIKFGDLHVHTASHDQHDTHSESFIIRQAKDPMQVKEIILDLARKRQVEELGGID